MNKLMYYKLQRGSGNIEYCYICDNNYDKDDTKLQELHTDGKCKCATPDCDNQSILITGQGEQKKHRFHPIQTWAPTLCIECNLGVKCECKNCENDGNVLYPVNVIVFRFEPNAAGSDHIQKNLHIDHQLNCGICGFVDKDGTHCCSNCDPAL